MPELLLQQKKTARRITVGKSGYERIMANSHTLDKHLGTPVVKLNSRGGL